MEEKEVKKQADKAPAEKKKAEGAEGVAKKTTAKSTAGTAKKTAAEKKPAAKKPAAEKKTEAKSTASTAPSSTAEKPAASAAAPKADKQDKGKIKITLVKSLTGRNAKHIATANSLGLKRIGNFTVQPDNQQTRGKIGQIGYLITVTYM